MNKYLYKRDIFKRQINSILQKDLFISKEDIVVRWAQENGLGFVYKDELKRFAQKCFEINN